MPQGRRVTAPSGAGGGWLPWPPGDDGYKGYGSSVARCLSVSRASRKPLCQRDSLVHIGLCPGVSPPDYGEIAASGSLKRDLSSLNGDQTLVVLVRPRGPVTRV